MAARDIPLSVLDLAPVTAGSSASEALARSTELIGRAEALGYHRYWVAEHHNMPGIASSSPAVLLAHLAASSTTIRVGSGGVMLPNHAPLVVAEQFGLLEALHPGRVDLGIGRAPGSDPVTASALRRHLPGSEGDDLPEQLGALFAFFHGNFPDGHPWGSIRALPEGSAVPDVWLLGSSGYSAQVAGILGLPFAFAHHFSPTNTVPAIELYRARFRPSERLAESHVMVGVATVCAPSAEEADWLHGSSRLSMLRLRTGRPGPLPSPEEAASYESTSGEDQVMASATSSHVVGDPTGVVAGLQRLVDATGADELMVTTNVFDHAARLRSYELVADAWSRAGDDRLRTSAPATA